MTSGSTRHKCSGSRRCLEEVSASKNLTIQEREQFAQQLEDLRKETRTKEQQLAHEKKQLEEQLTEQDRRCGEGRQGMGAALPRRNGGAGFAGRGRQAARRSTSTRSCRVLRPMTRLIEITDEKTGKGTGKFKVVVDFPDTDPEYRRADRHAPHARQRREADEGPAANLRQPF